MSCLIIGHWLAIEGVQPAIVQNPTPADLKSSETNTTSGGGATSSLAATSGAEGVETKIQVKHVLSTELQLYFERIASALTNEDSENVRETAIASLRTDPGLHQLVPYLVAFIAEKVLCLNFDAYLDHPQSQKHFDIECHAPNYLGTSRQPKR